eukprot:CAMPEP_0118655810 /NCGR_PEP_ID=MMETSP0785-20121206/13142_1 /TAXON_ID=91992 /ORGANISM="Bolidomonas pacifica, Strain CCMP 1866" /LENGTH=244 /DNA_ID=CAMNT_0006548603 /DNA_START=139 /DNA_END=873 /DNA_ORIENTATION=+
MATPHVSVMMSQDDVVMKKFGLSQDQLARAKVLRQMGVTEDDLQIAGQILSLMPPEPEKGMSDKAEVLMGYDSTRLNREKALRMLGVSEEELDVENEKILGSLGVDGRKRSFRLGRSVSAPLFTQGSKRGSWFSRKSSGGYHAGVQVEGGRKRGSSVMSNINSAFEGWNCTSAFGAVDEKEVEIAELKATSAQKDATIDVLRERLTRFMKENKELKAKLKEKEEAEEVAAATAADEGFKGWFGK